MYFGMRFSGTDVKTLPDNLAAAGNDTAYAGIGRC